MLSGRTFAYKDDTKNGIFKYFYDNYNSQYYDLVKTTASSNNGYAQRALDYTSNYWHVEDYKGPGSYIIFYLSDYFVKLQGYSITSSNINPASGICHPKNWGLDASYDMVKWVHQVNITDDKGEMNKYASTKYFSWSHGTYNVVSPNTGCCKVSHFLEE